MRKVTLGRVRARAGNSGSVKPSKAAPERLRSAGGETLLRRISSEARRIWAIRAEIESVVVAQV